MSEPDLVPISDLVSYVWRDGDLSYKLHDAQKNMLKQVEDCTSGEVLVLSSRQIGKSYFAAACGIRHCIKYPGSIVRILAPTLKQVEDIVQDNMSPLTADAPPGMVVRQKSSYRWTIGSSSLRLGALERAHVDNNRGGNASLVICEEGGFVRSDDYEYAVRSVIGPQLLHSGGKLIHVTTPSEDPMHYIHTEVLPRAVLNKSLSRYTIYDNPLLTEDQIAKAMFLCGGENSTAWKREYLVEILRDPSLMIVPSFERAKHVVKIVPADDTTWQITIDTGGVRDKTVGLVYTYDYLRNKIQILNEFVCEPNTATDEIVESARNIEKQAPGVMAHRWADVSGQLQIDLRKLHGYDTNLPAKDDWQSAINKMQITFLRNEIEIDPDCVFLLASLEAGQYNRTKTDFGRSEALGHCDALAALMYAIRMVDKKSPYPEMHLSRQLFFQKPTEQGLDISNAITPKSFTQSKRFGSFK